MADFTEEMEQVLTTYNTEVIDKIKAVTRESMKELVKETKATAPRGRRNGQFRKNIAADYRNLNNRSGGRLLGVNMSAVWHVKAPDYRLTHLIVHGHATRNGGRTTANPFLQNALNKVLPEYERKVQEAISNGN